MGCDIRIHTDLEIILIISKNFLLLTLNINIFKICLKYYLTYEDIRDI